MNLSFCSNVQNKQIKIIIQKNERPASFVIVVLLEIHFEAKFLVCIAIPTRWTRTENKIVKTDYFDDSGSHLM
jgi:hypothetical protein